MELTFQDRFTLADLEAVKSIAGRRWVPDQRVWVIPHTPAAMAVLEGTFGPRLAWEEGPAQADLAPDPVASASPDRPGPGLPKPASAPPAPDSGPPAGERRPNSPAVRPGCHAEAERIVQNLRRVLRIREYSPKTERAYIDWVRRFLAFHGASSDPSENLQASHAEAFLEHLARQRLSAKSRNLAASALAFMFREVLGRDDMANVPRAKGPKRVPTVLAHREVLHVLRQLTGKYFLIGVLLYSAGLRLEECLRIRVKDIDFELRQILVRNGKGQKDRYAPLAHRAVELLRAQIRRIAELHEKDRAEGHGWAGLPGALHRKDPMAGYELGWQYLFPASTVNTDPATGRTGRRSLHPTAVQRAVKAAVRRAGITKRATCHTFRHSFATEALRGGCDIRTLQHVMGHKDIRTTMIYLHVVEQTGFFVRSPLDRPDDLEEDGQNQDRGGVPWAGIARQWEVAARQWDRPRQERRPPTARDRPPRERN